ncbi:MAG: mannonate dehydratase [Hyphomicrobiales bacterium]|nr:mannonate dehydratase [Hyphomicrobiales bacterium]MDE2016375.1 mannonate dehydratase [Hyphomicrobiales bacterium]
MFETWRWFGPDDPVTLAHVRQTGASGIVTALHDVPPGRVWPLERVLERKRMIEAAGLVWSVVESIPTSEALKLGDSGRPAALDAWKQSLVNVAKAGVKVVCYNFMAITDWTRTDLEWPMPHGGTALRFDAVDFAAYDLFMLKREGAEADYAPARRAEAEARFKAMDEATKARLEGNLIGWVPARDLVFDRDSFRAALARYHGMGREGLRANLLEFLREVSPLAQELGVRLGIHPDDPPFSLFGLPRVTTDAADLRAILAASPEPANGVTFCTGSLGAGAGNDLPAMAREFGPRINFVHLRNVKREADGSFHEAEHLEGDTDMVAVAKALLAEEARRRVEGRPDAVLPYRPDHGHRIVDDIGKKVNPGYSCIGRLKGLAELRGIFRALAA